MKMMRFGILAILATAAPALFAQPAQADIKIGIVIPATGPAAAFGVPQQKAIALMPTTIAGEKVTYIVLDSNTDPTKATANARKLLTEDNVDILIGESTTAATLPLVELAAERATPLLALAPTASIVAPMDAKKRWVFKIVPNDEVSGRPTVKYMAKQGYKKVAFIGFSDAYGQGWYDIVKELLPQNGMEIVATEWYARSDTSTAAQVLKLVAAKPDVMFMAGSAVPGGIPAREARQRGYTGPIIMTHGIAFPAFIDRGGADVEGIVFAAEPLVVAADLPDSSPFKKVTSDFITRYKEANGEPPSIFAGHIADCITLASQAIPDALKKAKPGTPEFRAALRDGLENVKNLYLNNGLLTNSPQNHVGYDEKGVFLVKIDKGAFRLIAD
jgi:branched-chain amino acid transport system substrate-binding protein